MARVRGPLRPSTYLIRNAGRTLPLSGVIVLAVLLVAGIVSLMNSIPLSIRTVYSNSRYYLGVAPRGDPYLIPKVRDRILKDSPVPIDKVILCRGSDVQVHSIVGKFPFVVLGLEQNDMRYYVARMGNGKLDGKYPAAGQPEALVSEPVARNLNLKLGDVLIGPDVVDGYSPKPVHIVGIVQTTEWIAMAPIEYHRANHFPPIDVMLVFAKNLADEDKLDHWAIKTFKGTRARMFAFFELERETREMFDILYKILDLVVFALVIVITLMMGMLMNIYQSQRIQEFGLLQALGYTKRTLLSRLLGETAWVVLTGWGLGVLCAYGLLWWVKVALMDPRAFALDPSDLSAYLYTIPVPIAIFVVGLMTVVFRLRKFDPVAVIERRLV